MYKKVLFIICCLSFVFVLGACKNDKDTSETGVGDGQELATEETEAADIAAEEETVMEEKHGITVNFESELLKDTLEGSSPSKRLYIYLPPSYYESGERYPVVYFFHGFGESPTFVFSSEGRFTKAMQQPEMKEFIIVGVDGQMNYGEGSFWSNSPVTGPWEDYVLKEIIPYVDENYRTIASAESRGIAGFSMGGFATVNLSFRNPDVFSCVLATCPGLLKEGSLELAMDSWMGDTSFLECYGQAFSPNVNNEKLCDIPAMDGSEADAVIRENWETGFGNLEEKVDAYLAKNQPLKAIHIIYGSQDYYKWIPEGCVYFSGLLTEKGIKNTLTEVKGGHSLPPDYVDGYLVPFFTNNLVFED